MGAERWAETTLGRVVLFTKGKRPARLEPSPFMNSSPYIDREAVETGAIRRYADDASSVRCSSRDVLVVWEGSGYGLAGTDLEGAVGASLACCTPVVVEPGFLYRFIQRNVGTIRQKPKGTSVPRVDPDVFLNLKFPLPPRAEQRRIVARINAVLSRAGSVGARLDRVQGMIGKFRRSVLAAAFSGRLTGKWRVDHARRTGKALPGWAEVLASELFSAAGASDGRIGSSAEEDATLLGSCDLNYGTITIDVGEKRFAGAAGAAAVRVRTSDLLVAVTAEGGLIGLVPPELDGAYVEEGCAAVRPAAESDPQYLAWYFVSAGGQAQLRQLQKSTEMAGPYDLRRLIIPIPSLEEQREVVRRLKRLFAIADSVGAAVKRAHAHVERIQESVLASAFSGGLVKSDLNDESAAELLKRITAEKKRLEGPEEKPRRKQGKRNN